MSNNDKIIGDLLDHTTDKQKRDRAFKEAGILQDKDFLESLSAGLPFDSSIIEYFIDEILHVGP